MNLFKRPGKPLPQLGKKRSPKSSYAKAGRGGDRSLLLTTDKRKKLERFATQGTGTLPERIVERALIDLDLTYTKQAHVGSALVIGGGVVDFVVYYGPLPGVAVRVQGDYWHTMRPRMAKDRVQFERLKAKGYRVFDAWEHDVYEAALGGFIHDYVTEGLDGAQ